MADFRHPECMPAGKGAIARRTQRVHFAEMRSLFAEQRPISIGSLPTTNTPIVPHFGRNICRFPNTPASASSTTISLEILREEKKNIFS